MSFWCWFFSSESLVVPVSVAGDCCGETDVTAAASVDVASLDVASLDAASLDALLVVIAAVVAASAEAFFRSNCSRAAISSSMVATAARFFRCHTMLQVPVRGGCKTRYVSCLIVSGSLRLLGGGVSDLLNR